MYKFITPGQRITVLLALFYHIVSLSCSPSKGFEKPEDEEYNQVVEPEPEDTVIPPVFRRNQTKIPKELRERMNLTFTKLSNDEVWNCKLEGGSFTLAENRDYSVEFKISGHGIIKKEGNWTTYCHCTIEVPWTMEPPPPLPYSWTYLDEHLNQNNTETMAIWDSRVDTGPAVYRLNEQNPEERELLYPCPGGVDPNNVILNGKTTFLPGTIATWEGDNVIIAQSDFEAQDHEGTRLRVQFSMKPENSE